MRTTVTLRRVETHEISFRLPPGLTGAEAIEEAERRLDEKELEGGDVEILVVSLREEE